MDFRHTQPTSLRQKSLSRHTQPSQLRHTRLRSGIFPVQRAVVRDPRVRKDDEAQAQ
ncbi:hypothetical protein [Zhongshania borealis]|uniref:hypothetical protein n=1 Tax=Zhongshania borealis TaxID=889488 RepID=UPI0031E9D58D